ncbi:MAG: plasmid mobilization relaxosome protein MobC [Bacteroidota bacterium]
MATEKPKKKKSEKRQRQKYAITRLTDAEKAELQTRAANQGLSESDYLRRKALGSQPLKATKRIKPEREALLSVAGQLARYGNNLNQLARKANRQQNLSPADIEDLREAIALVNELREEVRKALGYDT